ncbi:MAG: hypothetical protein H0U74_10320 [Bradymonadaceae bacterium]|nr:hypothetical protein [Lujinxingiaceae bacterium]
MSQEDQNFDEPNEPSQAPTLFGAAVTAAIEQLSALAAGRPAVSSWFARWLPALAALRRVGASSMHLAGHVREHFEDELADPLPPEMIIELGEGFRELAQAFPDVTALLFDIDQLDAFIADVLHDPDKHLVGSTIMNAVNERASRAIAKIVELAFLPSKMATLSPQATLEFLEHAERLLDRAIRRWILPHVDPSQENP